MKKIWRKHSFSLGSFRIDKKYGREGHKEREEIIFTLYFHPENKGSDAMREKSVQAKWNLFPFRHSEGKRMKLHFVKFCLRAE